MAESESETEKPEARRGFTLKPSDLRAGATAQQLADTAIGEQMRIVAAAFRAIRATLPRLTPLQLDAIGRRLRKELELPRGAD